MTGNERILDFAKEIQINARAEADAIEEYTHALRMLEIINFDSETHEHIKSVIAEIIGDELNHQKRLTALYTELTGIKVGT